MKAVKQVTFSAHYLFRAIAVLSLLGLLSFSGASVRTIVQTEASAAYGSFMLALAAAFVFSSILDQVCRWLGKPSEDHG